jgi:hypothetical protein
MEKRRLLVIMKGETLYFSIPPLRIYPWDYAFVAGFVKLLSVEFTSRCMVILYTALDWIMLRTP